ncbi:hypothetical protein F5B22DRAFT_637225 [Xylaria bambusicola]|uniref:uncharacterized protein n=1 Tax=Xylaria bambusicola TaxID=326684 RepID=UPI0020088DBE|nr:uncharacterized protein F5B22DRAFT_637225 [Xylaria bambusicola]KAI0513281.1 hypothetical protein F5B22DRAFT_637225 [Xylaria bambusicola]
MDEHSKLQTEVSDVDLVLGIDEAEFETLPTSMDPKGEYIKRKTLDRLAEMLARFKTARGSGPRKNSAAKHVTSTVMVENSTGKALTIFCAKNEGLDNADNCFLERLETLLRQVATSDEEIDPTQQFDRIFELIYEHQQPRVLYYAEIIRKELRSKGNQHDTGSIQKLTVHNIQRCPRAEMNDWRDNNGLIFRFNRDYDQERPNSDEGVACPSEGNEENMPVQGISHQIIQTLNSMPVQLPWDSMKHLLEKVHRIILNPRHRPVLKLFLKQAVQGDGRSFDRAWDALLYLTRIYDATDIRNLKLEAIPVPTAFTPQNMKMSPIQSLKFIGHNSLKRPWQTFFQEKEKVEAFSRQQRLKRNVHGEVQLIHYVESLIYTNGRDALTIFPYLGCSKKCCFFCEGFRAVHGIFQARGTHHTVFPLWALPSTIPQPSLHIIRQFSDHLKQFLSSLLLSPRSPPKQELLRQSSAALSTAQAIQRDPATYSTRSQESTKMMVPWAVTATEHSVEFYPLPESPGRAQVIGGSGTAIAMPIEDAELTKINHDRKAFKLEQINEMPHEIKHIGQRSCRRCGKLATYRCSACRTSYCSKDCQKRDWKTHVFVCRVANRPHDVDILSLTIRKTKRDMISGSIERTYNAIRYLLADDRLCTTFGFNNCATDLELADLVCLYSNVLARARPSNQGLQQKLNEGVLGEFLKNFCQLERRVAEITGKDECTCVTWFLERRTSEEAFPIPGIETEPYGIWDTAVSCAIQSLQLTERVENGPMFNKSQSDVFRLYVAIPPYVQRFPDVRSSLWTKFGFCYCRTFEQRQSLATSYWNLLAVSTFDEIVAAYQTATLFDLMQRHGIGTPPRVQETRPIEDMDSEDGIFRLMIGVEHALSGNFCNCFQYDPSWRCRSYFETHLDREADGNFGFHMRSSWERWQLLNFYKYVFALPDFDPGEMAKARQDVDPKRLEKYLDTLVPDAKTKLIDRYRFNPFFPRFEGRVSVVTQDRQRVPGWHRGCGCKIHDVLGPPGLSYRVYDPV